MEDGTDNSVSDYNVHQKMKYSLPALLAVIVMLFVSCASPAALAPKRIVVIEDIRFTWRPPIGFPERETTLSAGTYEYRTTDFQGHIFFSSDGQVSIGRSGEKIETRPGGIGIDKFGGALYVWYSDITIEMLLPIGPAVFYGKGGRPLYQYIGKLPKDMISKVRLEQ